MHLSWFCLCVGSMSESADVCQRCSGCTASDGVSSMTSKQVVMLYDLEHAQQLLSGATLADLPEVYLSLKPADQPGKLSDKKQCYIQFLHHIMPFNVVPHCSVWRTSFMSVGHSCRTTCMICGTLQLALFSPRTDYYL